MIIVHLNKPSKPESILSYSVTIISRSSDQSVTAKCQRPLSDSLAAESERAAAHSVRPGSVTRCQKTATVTASTQSHGPRRGRRECSMAGQLSIVKLLTPRVAKLTLSRGRLLSDTLLRLSRSLLTQRPPRGGGWQHVRMITVPRTRRGVQIGSYGRTVRPGLKGRPSVNPDRRLAVGPDKAPGRAGGATEVPSTQHGIGGSGGWVGMREINGRMSGEERWRW
eukprot:763833-Hanusia_phi.AAC.4